MRKNLSYFAVLLFMSMALIVAGCQPQLLPPMNSNFAEDNVTDQSSEITESSDIVADDSEVAENVEGVDEPTQQATSADQSDIIDAIVEAIEAPAEDVATETLSVEIVQPAVPAAPLAYVTGTPIRIHAGPGANYALHGVADQGTTFALIGQANDCQWYQVQHPSVGTAWIAGTDGNVTIYNATCPQIPLVTN